MVTLHDIRGVCGAVVLSLVLPANAWGQDEPPAEPQGDVPSVEATPEPDPPKAPEPKKARKKKRRKNKRDQQVRVVRIHHAPISVADAGEPLRVRVSLEDVEGTKRALLVYRTGAEKKFRELELSRSADGPYAAEVPAEQVVAPSLEYTIELEQDDGKRVAVFASRRKPHRVLVPRDGMDRIEEVAAGRLDDRRSVFSASGEYVSFGRSPVVIATAAGPEAQTVDDRYWRVEGSFTYRPLRAVSEFSFAAGVIRGSAPSSEPVPGQSEDKRFDVGLNYGSTRVRFRLADWFHVDGTLLVSVTELGFSVGTGSSLHIGEPYGNKLVLGFEAIQSFGVSAFTRLDFMAHRQVRLSPIVEITNMPSADAFGLRLLGELGVDIGWGFGVVGRGGYQARDATSGGPSAGGSLAYAF